MMYGLREVKNIHDKKYKDEFTVCRAVMVTTFSLDFTLPHCDLPIPGHGAGRQINLGRCKKYNQKRRNSYGIS